MKIIFAAAALSVSLLGMGCAAHTSLMPLGEGRLAPSISVGGPLIEAFDTHFPIPYLMAGADYGVSDHVNINGALHLLPLAFSVAGLDVGATWFPVENEGWQPTLGIGPRLSVFSSTKKNVDERFLVYPAATGSAAWEMGRGLLYAGGDIAIPLSRLEYDEEAGAMIFSPFAGYRWNLGRRWALLTEVKWHGVNIEADKSATGYTTVWKQGAVAPLFAFQRGF